MLKYLCYESLCSNEIIRYESLPEIFADSIHMMYITPTEGVRCRYLSCSKLCEDGHDHLYTIIKYLLNIESLSQITPGWPSSSDVCEFESHQPPQNILTDMTSKLLSINPRLLCDSVRVDLSKSLNSANCNIDLYTLFKEHLVSEYTIGM